MRVLKGVAFVVGPVVLVGFHFLSTGFPVWVQFGFPVLVGWVMLRLIVGRWFL